MAKPLLLTYNLKPDTASGLDRVCRRLGIRVRQVARDEYARPIGALAGIPVAGPASQAQAVEPAVFGDEMLVICHMLSGELDALLQAIRDEGVPRIALKAVLTPVNVLWNSSDLRNELVREYTEVQKRSGQPR